MPRRPRLDAPGAVHHVWMRGVDRRDLFRDDADRRVFFARLSTVLPEERVACFAWVLMTNHVHLVLRTGRRPLARAMHRTLTAYAGHFNARYGHEGHVFDRRFGSRRVDDDGDLRNLIRYVHRNPVSAGLVRSIAALARWPWSGHRALCGDGPAAPFHSIGDALACFGPTPRAARAELRTCMEWTDAERGVPGDLGEAALRSLVSSVCRELGADEWEVRGGGRSREASSARAAIARIARRELALPDVVIARALGVTRQAMWRRIGARPRGS